MFHSADHSPNVTSRETGLLVIYLNLSVSQEIFKLVVLAYLLRARAEKGNENPKSAQVGKALGAGTVRSHATQRRGKCGEWGSPYPRAQVIEVDHHDGRRVVVCVQQPLSNRKLHLGLNGSGGSLVIVSG